MQSSGNRFRQRAAVHVVRVECVDPPPLLEQPRARSLLPFTHWTLVERGRVLPGLDELFVRLGTELPSALAIVTGPSRSADIEQRLAVGVHGPGDVQVLIR